MKLCVTNQKGGVAKSGLCFHLAYLFAKKMPTLVIDLDPQGNLTSMFLGATEKEIPDECNTTHLFDGSNDCDTFEIRKNLHLIGSDISLSEYEGNVSMKTLKSLKRFLSDIDDSDLMIIIDTPPNLGLFTSNALLASDYVLIPVDTSRSALKGLDSLYSIIDQDIRDMNPLKVAGIVFPMFIDRNNEDIKMMNQIKELYPKDLFEEYISHTVKVKEAVNRGIPIFEYFSKHKASKQYKKLFVELSRRIGIK